MVTPQLSPHELLKRIWQVGNKLVEPDMFGELPPLPATPKNLKDKGQRLACGRMISKDIGMYNTCRHFCVYCYANTSRKCVVRNAAKHNDESESIIG